MLGATENPSEYEPAPKPIKFNQKHWEVALAGVFAKAALDPEYRSRCLTDARWAVHDVAPNLELPADFNVSFVDQSKDLVHTYLLPSSLPHSPILKVEDLQLYTIEANEVVTDNWTATGTPRSTNKICQGIPVAGSSGQ